MVTVLSLTQLADCSYSLRPRQLLVLLVVSQ